MDNKNLFLWLVSSNWSVNMYYFCWPLRHNANKSSKESTAGPNAKTSSYLDRE